MALQGVRQENGTGCFIAAIASLLGKTYNDVFSMFYPGQDQWTTYEHGFRDLSMETAALTALSKVGIKARLSKLKKFRSYAKKSKHALLIIRWSFAPDLCHTIVYDGDTHKFIDPSYGDAIRADYKLKSLEEQLDFGIIIDQLPKEHNESQRRFGDGLQPS